MKYTIGQEASSIPLLTRWQHTPVNVFLKVFSRELRDRIIEYTEAAKNWRMQNLSHLTNRIWLTLLQRLLTYVAHGQRSSRVFWKKRSSGLSYIATKCFASHSHLMKKSYFELFNNGLKSVVQFRGHTCVDEQMWKWYAQDPIVRTLPRKPTDTGVKVVVHCAELKNSTKFLQNIYIVFVFHLYFILICLRNAL